MMPIPRLRDRETRPRLLLFPRAFGFSWRKAATPILKDSRCDAVATLAFPHQATIRICFKSCSEMPEGGKLENGEVSTYD